MLGSNASNKCPACGSAGRVERNMARFKWAHSETPVLSSPKRTVLSASLPSRSPVTESTVDLLLTISTAPCTECTGCTDATGNRTDSTGRAGSIRRPVPRAVPRAGIVPPAEYGVAAGTPVTAPAPAEVAGHGPPAGPPPGTARGRRGHRAGRGAPAGDITAPGPHARRPAARPAVPPDPARITAPAPPGIFDAQRRVPGQGHPADGIMPPARDHTARRARA